MTFWDAERLVVQVIFLFLIYLVVRGLHKLLQQGVRDRDARENDIAVMKKTADDLVKKNAEILAKSEARVDKVLEVAPLLKETIDALKEKNGH